MGWLVMTDREASSMPDPIYIAWAANGHIRKWDTSPFEIDGKRAIEMVDSTVDGVHTCPPDCDRPMCALRRENDRLRLRLAEIENADRSR